MLPALALPLRGQASSPATERLHARVLAASPVVETQRAAIAVAEARRGLAGLDKPLIVTAGAEEVPGVNLLKPGNVRIGIGRDLVPRARRTAELALADEAIMHERLVLHTLEQALTIHTNRLLATSAGSSAIAARFAAEDSLLGSAEEAVRSRFSVGDARYVDVLRLRTERLRVNIEMQRAQADARIAFRQIIRLVDGDSASGAAADVRAALAEEATRATSAMLAAAPAVDSLLAGANAVQLASQEITRARAAQRLARAQQQPVLTPTIGFQRFTGDNGFRFGPTLGLSISLPNSVRGSRGAQETLGIREVAFAEARGRATTARIAIALAAAADRYEAAQARIASFDATLLRGAREEREAALASYRSGGLTLLELLDFERALAQAEIARMQSRIDAIDARSDLLLIAIGADELSEPIDASRGAHKENVR